MKQLSLNKLDVLVAHPISIGLPRACSLASRADMKEAWEGGRDKRGGGCSATTIIAGLAISLKHCNLFPRVCKLDAWREITFSPTVPPCQYSLQVSPEVGK